MLELHNCEQRRLLTQALEIGARQTLGPMGELLQVDIGRQRHTLAAELQSGGAICSVGLREGKYEIKSTAS